MVIAASRHLTVPSAPGPCQRHPVSSAKGSAAPHFFDADSAGARLLRPPLWIGADAPAPRPAASAAAILGQRKDWVGLTQCRLKLDTKSKLGGCLFELCRTDDDEPAVTHASSASKHHPADDGGNRLCRDD